MQYPKRAGTVQQEKFDLCEEVEEAWSQYPKETGKVQPSR